MTENLAEPSVEVRSCSTCPSFLKHDDYDSQIKQYGSIYKLPTCPLKGKLLGGTKSEEHNRSVQEKIGSTCDMHGQTPPRSARLKTVLTVALPMPTVGEPTANVDQPTSCRGCTSYVPANIMAKQVAVPGGFCSKRGILISEQSTSKVAKDCNVGELLAVNIRSDKITDHFVNNLVNVYLLPEIKPALVLGDVIGSNLPEEDVDIVEADSYISDAPVTPEDEKRGIRAWRKVSNNDDTRHIMMPIFERSFFSTEEQAKIPQTGDQNHPELYRDHMNLEFKVGAIWQMGETPALHGVAGTGKTQLFNYLAWRMGLPFERVSITATTELDDLAGKMHFDPEKGTHFEEGRIPKAWAKPCIQVIDEPNVGPPPVWQFIRPMTDNAKQLVLDMADGRIIPKHQDSYLGMAMNPAWDYRNVGAETISDADGSRLMHIFVDLPEEKVEKEILRKACMAHGFQITQDQLKMVMKIAEGLREMSNGGSLPITWGIRPQIKVARLLEFFDYPEAYRLAAADYLEPQSQQLILDKVMMAAN